MYIISSFALLLTCAYAASVTSPVTSAGIPWKTEVPITANTFYSNAGQCARNCATSIFSSYSSKLKAVAPNSDCNTFPACMCSGTMIQSIEKAIGLCASSSYLAKAPSCTATDILSAGAIFEAYCMAGMGLAQVQTMNPTSVVSVATRVAASATALMTTTSTQTSSTSVTSSQAAATSKSSGDVIQSLGSLEYIFMLVASMLFTGW